MSEGEVNLGDILDIPMEDVKRPKPAPTGTYVGMVVGHPERGKSKNKGTDYSMYTIQLMESCDDVDDKALEEYLNGEALSSKTIRVTYYHTKDSRYRLNEFFQSLGIEMKNDDSTPKKMSEAIQEVPGKTAYFKVNHTPAPDGSAVYANVTQVIKL